MRIPNNPNGKKKKLSIGGWISNHMQTGTRRANFSIKSKSNPPNAAMMNANGDTLSFTKTSLPEAKEFKGLWTAAEKKIQSVEPIST